MLTTTDEETPGQKKANPRLMGSKEELIMTAGSGSESATQLQKQYAQRRNHLEHVAAIAERTSSANRTKPMSQKVVETYFSQTAAQRATSPKGAKLAKANIPKHKGSAVVKTSK